MDFESFPKPADNEPKMDPPKTPEEENEDFRDSLERRNRHFAAQDGVSPEDIAHDYANEENKAFDAEKEKEASV